MTVLLGCGQRLIFNSFRKNILHFHYIKWPTCFPQTTLMHTLVGIPTNNMPIQRLKIVLNHCWQKWRQCTGYSVLNYWIRSLQSPHARTLQIHWCYIHHRAGPPLISMLTSISANLKCHRLYRTTLGFFLASLAWAPTAVLQHSNAGHASVIIGKTADIPPIGHAGFCISSLPWLWILLAFNHQLTHRLFKYATHSFIFLFFALFSCRKTCIC